SVQFRLRVNQRGRWSSWIRVVNSYFGEAPSVGNPKVYDLFFDPHVSGTEDNKVLFSFDILSFDANDDTNSWLYLEDLFIEEIQGSYY
ncbi:MAG: hypothetical protein N2246_02555, partial [Candidatus Sumerlaeia bacterium]|nr:hypothetical protein [Candidatus Sumerlaeia bacterium]